MKGFYENVQNEIKSLVETTNENTNINPEIAIYEEERRNFVVNGRELDRRSKLIREINKIRLHFTHMEEAQFFSFEKYSSIRDVIDQLSDEISYPSYEEDVLRGMVVLLDLELGINISYKTDFISLYRSGLLRPFEEIRGYSFEKLGHDLREKPFKNEEQNIREVADTIRSDNFDYIPVDDSVSQYKLEQEAAKKDEEFEGFIKTRKVR